MEKYRYYVAIIYDIGKFMNNKDCIKNPLCYSFHTSNDNIILQNHIHIIVACTHTLTIRDFEKTLKSFGIEKIHFDVCNQVIAFINYMRGNSNIKFKIEYLNDFKSILQNQ